MNEKLTKKIIQVGANQTAQEIMRQRRAEIWEQLKRERQTMTESTYLELTSELVDLDVALEMGFAEAGGVE